MGKSRKPSGVPAFRFILGRVSWWATTYRSLVAVAWAMTLLTLFSNDPALRTFSISLVVAAVVTLPVAWDLWMEFMVAVDDASRDSLDPDRW